jgi:phenylalanyl-tRNA synthetase alpha chain
LLHSPSMDAAEALATLERERERGRQLADDARSLADLGLAQTAVLGRKAPFSEVQRSLGQLSEEERRSVGRRVNEVRAELEAVLSERREQLASEAEAALIEADRADVTLPGRRLRAGSLHPLTIIEDRIVEVFTRMGYRVAEGPEIEDEWHNFEALNIPPDHPARTLKDSLYVDVPGMLLRTETSAVQIRTMESQEPPVAIIAPGRTYRREAVDATHLSVFHQVEGLAVDEGIRFSDLKGTLEAFAKAMFGERVRIRMNPDYFPFVEPGCQVAVSCFICDGVGCRVCGNGWIELLGAGMVHPKVLENCGYDAERYTGFAFGVGIERVAMVALDVQDMRQFVEGDVRFLARFEGAA